jgi:hypothetical protein
MNRTKSRQLIRASRVACAQNVPARQRRGAAKRPGEVGGIRLAAASLSSVEAVTARRL